LCNPKKEALKRSTNYAIAKLAQICARYAQTLSSGPYHRVAEKKVSSITKVVKAVFLRP